MLNYLFEVRNRLLIISIHFFSLIIVCYCYKEILLFLVINPYKVLIKLSSDYFIFTNVTELFSIYMRVIYFITIYGTVVSFLYHWFIFASSSFFKQEYFFLLKFLKTLFLLLLASILIARYVLIPISWSFFYNFQNLVSNTFISLHFEPKLNEYLNFCLLVYNVCILYLQAFTFLFLIIWYYNRNTENIKKGRKLYYYSFLIFSTLISPPDLLSQLFVSSSFVFLFELLIIWVIFIRVTDKVVC